MSNYRTQYDLGDALSRNSEWTLTHGTVKEVLENKDKTELFYLVESDFGDRFYCKGLVLYAGKDYGLSCSYSIDDRVVVGFIDSNPENQIYIIGAVRTPGRPIKVLESLRNYSKDIKDYFLTTATGQSLTILVQKYFNLKATEDVNIASDKDIYMDAVNINVAGTTMTSLGDNATEKAVNGDKLYDLLDTLIGSIPDSSLQPNPTWQPPPSLNCGQN